MSADWKGFAVDSSEKLQQRELAVTKHSEVIERAILGAVGSKMDSYPLSISFADSCRKHPISFMYCAFAYLIGSGSETAADNLNKFDEAYGCHLNATLYELFDKDEGFIETVISDFRALCR